MKKYPVVDNDRGFKLYGETRDTYGALIRVKESSADPLIQGWLFIEGGVLDGNDGAAHLTVEQAKDVIAALRRFVRDKA